MRPIQQTNRVFASPWHQTNSTSPGIAQVRTLANGTGLGPCEGAFVDTWEQLRFVVAQANYLDLIAPASYQGSGCNVVFVLTKPEARSMQLLEEPETAFSAVEDQIAAVKSSLSLQVKELAEVLNVERPTIYSWINGRNTPRQASRERLFALYELAKQWNRLSSAPLGPGLHEADEEGTTVFRLLRVPRLPKKRILDCFVAIAQARKSTEKQPSPPNAKVSLRDLAKKHRMDFHAASDEQQQLDLETGKRISPE